MKTPALLTCVFALLALAACASDGAPKPSKHIFETIY